MLMAMLMLQAMPAIAPGTAPAERLSAPMPQGFKVGFEAARGGQSIEERVPASETVQDWTRMVTLQRFENGAAMGAHGILDRLGQLFARACTGATVSPVTDANEDGRPVATLRVDCPHNSQTGKPETMFARAFEGATDLHMAQYAFRSVPSPAQAAEAGAYLAAVRLCPGEAAACAAPAR